MKFKSILLSVLLSFGLLPWAHAEVKSFDSFKSIPIVHEGRLKPLDTFARNLLLQFSGKDSYEGQSAISWLAKLFFTPQSTFNDKVILINDPDVPTALNIKPDEHRRYSYAQLRGAGSKLMQLQQEALNIDDHQRSLAENEIIRVADNVELYTAYSNEFVWASLDLRGQEAAANKDFLAQVMTMLNWAKMNKGLSFDVIPQEGQWVSPWQAIGAGVNDEGSKDLVKLWYQMAATYRQGDSPLFDTASRLYTRVIGHNLSASEAKAVGKFPLELIYNASMPFMWARVFYILAFIFFIISFASPSRIWYGVGLSSVMTGFAVHGFGLMSRIIIMARPPVTGLYETFIFVSFITVLLGLAIEHFNRRWLGIVTASIAGTILLFIAGRYAAEGDTLKMLVAVLNSNFWLATHVTTITMGYAATCVVGILGHIWLIQASLKKNQEVLDTTYKTTLGIMGVALTLTFLGTNLGGIWADQSWGRFWGWDPKENGALMIVLWLAILFHAKFAKMVNELGLAVGCVLAMMVVMWAWFGVNLLSIGLHSYGFTSGIANTLIVYAVFEIVFIIFTCVAVRWKWGG